MSVAGIMLVRDEVDIIERSVEHARAQVDYLLVADNRSTDGTYELLIDDANVSRLVLDREVAYMQSRKMTALARVARDRGYEWVVPMDADELWHGPEGMSVKEVIERQGPDVQIVRAELYDHMPPCEGLGGQHPFDAIVHRREVAGALPKVACRTHARLVIEPGNHGASYGEGTLALAVDGLTVEHYSWRTPEQYLRKIRNGLEAYGATDLDPTFGAHWRMFEGATDRAIMDHFRAWFCV